MPDAVPATPYWALPAADVLRGLGAGPGGLTQEEAQARQHSYGPNRLAGDRRAGPLRELARQFTQPIVLILIGATLLSLLLADPVDALIILGIILLSGLLGFRQEHQAAVTVSRLLEQVRVEVEVRRSGRVVDVPVEDVVPGDVLVLNAGDIVPCDCRVLTAEALQVDESTLTGEAYPRHKVPEPVIADVPLTDRHSALFQGTHVVSGKGEALAVVTGGGTQLAEVSRELTARPEPTSFEAGTTRLGLLLARVTAVLTAAILVLNVSLGRPLIDSALFSLALAIGVTPQMLPAIVSVGLATGARRLARAKVIVRRLDAIEDLGSMDVLCTDKTGTLTRGSITLAAAIGLDGEHDDRVAQAAAVNAALQTGFGNPLDHAVLERHQPDPGWCLVDEVPFDFVRKRLSVLADGPEGRVLITKGAYASVLEACTSVVTDSGEQPAGEGTHDALFQRLSGEGLRVLAVARRVLPDRSAVTADDERDMTLLGLLVFEDPPKAGLEDTVADLRVLGIRLCMLTGDNRYSARHVAQLLGDDDPSVLTGSQIDDLDDVALERTVEEATAFAELTPAHKDRIVEALRARGAVVGFLGDGINDAGPLHLADVGISVDTAVNVAKSAAAMVLLDKDLEVVADGVRLGRATFVNTLKYVFTTVSANFGNTASMAAASAFLPFLPMLPRQILLLNFLSDLPSVTLAADRVDPEAVQRPRHWDVHAVRNFMVAFGLLSSAFDLATFAVLLHVFDAGAALFHTGWFVGSALTELAVLMVLRTRRLAFRSRPGRALVLSSVAVSLVVLVLPFTPLVSNALGLVALSPGLVAALLGITLCYVVAAEVAKHFYYRAGSAVAAGRSLDREAGRRRALARLGKEHAAPAHTRRHLL